MRVWFTSCCLLCLSVAVTPGYFCCRGTSLLLFSPLRLSLSPSQSDIIPSPSQYSNSKSIGQFQIHLLTASSLYTCVNVVAFVRGYTCGDISVSCQLVSRFSFSFGRAWSLRFFLCLSLVSIAKSKKQERGVAGLGF